MTSSDTNRLDDAHSPDDSLCSLLARVAKGEREAFTAFYQQTCGRVYGLALRTIMDPEISRETTQDVFLMVWEQADRFDPTQGSPMAWLATITHRRAVDRVRAEQAGSRRELVWGLKACQHPFDEVADDYRDPVAAKRISACLTKLTDLQRESIGLAFYGCLTYREVAERLEIPVPTAKARIRDGLQRLKDLLGPVRP